MSTRSIELYDLSRLLDRARELGDELEDISCSKVGNLLVPEISHAAGEVLSALGLLKHEIKAQIGDPSDYQREGK